MLFNNNHQLPNEIFIFKKGFLEMKNKQIVMVWM